MDLNSDLMKSYEKEWKKLNDKDKLIQLGKLKQIDELKYILEMYHESILRELHINQCDSEEDCLNPKTIKPNRPYQDPTLIDVIDKTQKRSISE